MRIGRKEREETGLKQKEEKGVGRVKKERKGKGRQRALFLICVCPEKPQHKLQRTVSPLTKCLLACASL